MNKKAFSFFILSLPMVAFGQFNEGIGTYKDQVGHSVQRAKVEPEQQPGSPVYCTDLTLTQLKKSLLMARKELLPERRELGLAYIMKHGEQWRDCVNYNRKIYESVLE